MQNHANQSNTLQQRIDRTTTKLNNLKAQLQAREAREKTRRNRAGRATRNRALILWGVALEREALCTTDRIGTIQAILEKHLTRESERDVALAFLRAIDLEAKEKL